jgi:hypothetical protein
VLLLRILRFFLVVMMMCFNYYYADDEDGNDENGLMDFEACDQRVGLIYFAVI